MSTTDRQAWAVAALGLLVGVLVCAGLLLQSGGDPLTFAALGAEDTQTTPHVIDVYERDVHLRSNLGHDGRFFLVQALDPLYVSTDHAGFLDRPVYRGQRMLFPLIAGLGGLAPIEAVPWLMGATQVVALALGTFATARLAMRLGGRPELGLAFALSPAVLGEVGIGGAGVVALAAAIWATVLVEEERLPAAALWFAFAALAREVMLLYVAGVALHRLVRTRRIPWSIAIPPGLAVGAWGLYLRLRLDAGSGVDEVREFDVPLAGIVKAASAWTDDSLFSWAMRLLVAAALAGAVAAAVKRPNALTWGSVGFAVLAVLLSEFVWREWFDIARAVLPIFTAVAITIGTRAPQAVPDPDPASSGRSGERPKMSIGQG